MGNITITNLIVVAVMLIGITVLGHRLSGKSANKTSFFTADGGLPWWAVSASLYATVLSAISFISIPATVLIFFSAKRELRITFSENDFCNAIA